MILDNPEHIAGHDLPRHPIDSPIRRNWWGYVEVKVKHYLVLFHWPSKETRQRARQLKKKKWFITFKHPFIRNVLSCKQSQLWFRKLSTLLFDFSSFLDICGHLPVLAVQSFLDKVIWKFWAEIFSRLKLQIVSRITTEQSEMIIFESL